MPDLPRSDDLEGTWKFLEKGVSHIMEHLEEGLSFSSYMENYTVVYNYCARPKTNTNMSASEASRGANLQGNELYYNLVRYLSSHMQSIKNESLKYNGDALLQFYSHQWTKYTNASFCIHHIFKYLNNFWVKRKIDEGKAGVYNVYTLALVRWKLDMFDDIHEKVTETLLKTIERQRNGELVNTSLLKNVIDSYISLGFDEKDSSKLVLDVYNNFFEKPFITSTEIYYKAEAEKYISENSITDYMKKVEERLQEEKTRIQLYLHPNTTKALMGICDYVFIQNHSELLQSEFQNILDSNRQEDMTRIYTLLSRISNGINPLKIKFEAHICKEGLLAIEKIVDNSTNSVDPKLYIDTLLEVRSRYNILVATAFMGDMEFIKALDNACREFINRNKVCHLSSSKSSELLAKYCDSFLKKNSKNLEKNSIENTLTDIMTIFKYVEDKDVFQKFYSKMLAKRLINGTSALDEAEIGMISKLKEACGFEYTNKLQRMFQDISVSKDLHESFKESLQQSLDTYNLSIDFYIIVLGTGFWPLQPPSTPFNIPSELLSIYERFQSFYQKKHNGRKLNWLFQLSRGELRVNYLSNVKVPYTFQVSTYQMGILLAYNTFTSLSYEQLQNITALKKDILDASLNILVKANVLLISPPDMAIGDKDTKYNLNMNFKSKKNRVNLNIPTKIEQKQEIDETHKTIEEDRKLLMQSTIVRIMKARKVLKHVILIQETISQIKSRFIPKISDIKRCIDVLIEKEYLERSGKDEYSYLA
ncbi:hypothetical protein PORY_001655 [Pneumocystis oryctolagi]|uniref:Uncharacterized protein n=1 Tax=Pneumocystis oryctolagi TaxID=42067 RepID=A0ACB7CC57_9ASCO|nr:hypothetical protein PORY_001655 [Pneumocystis oryctolagi]